MVEAFYQSVLSSEAVGELQTYAHSVEYRPIVQEYNGSTYQSTNVHVPPQSHPVEKYIVGSFIAFNKGFFNYDLWGSFEIQFLKYTSGGKYDWHCDYGNSDVGARKKKLLAA